MNKRIISTILSIVFLTITVLPCLSGCSAVEDENHYTVVQWLDQVEENFNLLYYSEKEPLVKNVSVSDKNFDTVQIAAEWGIIEPNTEIKFDDRLTKELAADTLIRAMNCVTPTMVDISDSGDVNPLYLEKVMSSVNEGIFSLESGKFQPKKQISKDEADSAMLIAHDKWVNFSYNGVSYDKSVVKENVINLGGVRSENVEIVPAAYSVEYSGNLNFFDASGTYSDTTNKTITFAAGQVPAGLRENSVLTMPADDIVPTDYAVVVTGVTENSDGSVTVKTRNAKIEEVFDELDIQESGVVDFSEAAFFGPDGQRLFFGDNDTPSEPVGAMSARFSAEPVAKANNTFVRTNSVEPGDYVKKLGNGVKQTDEIKLYDGETVKVTFSVSQNIGEDGAGFGVNLKVKGEDDYASLSGEYGIDYNVKLDTHVKTSWEWFQIKVKELRLAAVSEFSKKAKINASLSDHLGSAQNYYEDHNGDGIKNGADWTMEAAKLRKFYNDTRHASKSWKQFADDAKGVSNNKILDIMLPKGFHFVIRAEFTLEGSVEFTMTQVNTIGVELVNGNLRPIDNKEVTKKLDLTAKVELAARVGFEYQIIGIDIADLGVKVGVGAKASSIWSSYDKSSNELIEICGLDLAIKPSGLDLRVDEDVSINLGVSAEPNETRLEKVCTEITVYPILSVYICSPQSLVGKLFCSFEYEIWNDETPWFTKHIENGTVVEECSISANEGYGVKTGANLTVSSDTYTVPVSDEADTGLRVLTVPVNTTINDVVIECDNPEVLEVENLMHKQSEVNLLPKGKMNLKVTGNIPNMKKKSSGGDLTEKEDSSTENEVNISFGSCFYQEVAGNPKPQFALTGKKNGTANVTITAGGESVTIPVQVGTGDEPIVSTGTLISKKGTFTLIPGERVQAEFDYIPEDKTIGDIEFSSEDSSIASVSSSGLISALKEGDVKIFAVLKGAENEYQTEFVIHVIEQTTSTFTGNSFANRYGGYGNFESGIFVDV